MAKKEIKFQNLAPNVVEIEMSFDDLQEIAQQNPEMTLGEFEEKYRRPELNHEIFSLNHKDFTCNECSESFMIRDDSKLNVCFSCNAILCDSCLRDHVREK